MLSWRRNLWTLAIAVVLSSSSYTMVVPFLPLYLIDLGVHASAVPIWSGVIFSSTFLVAAVMAPYWGRSADRGGKRRMVIRAGFSLAIVYFLGALVRGPVELLIVRILQGFANGFLPAAMAIVASTSPQQSMGFSLGFMQMGVLIGGILGPLLGGTLSHFFGMRASFVIAAAIIAVGTLGVKMLVDEPENSCSPSQSSILDDFKMAAANRNLLEMLTLLFIVQAVSMVLQPLLTLYIAQLQGQAEGVVLTAGLVFSLAGIAGAIAAPLWGRAGQRSGFRKIMVIAFGGAGVFNLGQYFAADIYWFSLLQFLYGLFVVGAYPSINTIAVSCVGEDCRGRIFGLTTTANQLGSMLGPLIGGVISSWVGIQAVFLFTGSMLLVLGGVVLLNSNGLKSRSAQEAVK
ncbi:MFS transporter [Anaerospora hongkongensis]|uniref:MFS transporter n=1 Tax=Anaerospora hongkongensis TaxID=244830 RepID=UPI002898EB42|nr:MFS transporter [Anaerospora hongkongensis]